MNKRKKMIYGIIASTAMLIIILDGGNAANSIKVGIDLCLCTVIPALFPFFVLSGVINSCLIGQRIPLTAPLHRICRIPTGAESILLIGMISGYPIGAQLVTEAYTLGALSKNDARRMLGFCSNAGPSFFFGILASVFTKPIISWILWGIHIISALITAYLLPGESTDNCKIPYKETITISKSLTSAIQHIAVVCGWVVLFRLILGFINKWIVCFLPNELQVLISGCVELSNGCILLNQIQCEGARFLLASIMLAIGGLCVAMQTVSVTGKLGTGFYFPGKLMQMLISLTISCILQPLLFKGNDLYYIPNAYQILFWVFTFIIAYFIRKKVVAFGRRMLYNTGN